MEVSGREVTTDLALANITTDNTNDNSNNDNGSVNERTPLATTVELNDAGFDFATIPASSDLADVSPTESSDDHQSLATLDTLPPELLEHVLYLVPPRQRQRAALSLARAVAGFEPSVKQLWTHMAVTRAAQIWPLWRKLKVEKRGAAAMRTFAMESWRGDADILNNILRCLPGLNTLLLNIGTNFAPEHLAELFERVRPDMRRMEMCFRPYVEQASYYQFLKGSYFDTAIETMYRTWPEVKNFTHLAIVQDVPPRKSAPPTREHSTAPSVTNSYTDLRMVGIDTPRASNFPSAAASRVASTVASTAASTDASAAATPVASDSEDSSDSSTPPTSVDSEGADELKAKGYTRHGPFPYLSERLQHCKPKTFAQPIVFFDVQCLSRFGASPVAKNLTHLRLRVPSRDIAYVLVSPATPARNEAGVDPDAPLFPSLRYLDLSTTNVRLDAVLATLLKNYTRLEHLVLDRVNLFGFIAREKGSDYCRELGGMCVSAGLARGKDRERAITAWDLAERTNMARREAERRRAQATASDENLTEAQRAERDRLRAEEEEREEMQRQIALARSRRGHRSAGHSTFSIRDRPARRGQASTSSTAINPADIPAADRAYFVLPPLPTLKTLCIGGEAPLLSSFRPSTWEDEFHSGWREGLAKLSGWAAHVADRYERAIKKADEWKEWHARQGKGTKETRGKGKNKAAANVDRPRPPLDIRLFRFPTMDEEATFDPSDPTVGLIEVHPAYPRDYLNVYKLAIADAELYTHSHAVRPPCILCTVPDCEGPRRRAEEGLGIDGRGGMDKVHKEGCGHMIGRQTWGWEGTV